MSLVCKRSLAAPRGPWHRNREQRVPTRRTLLAGVGMFDRAPSTLCIVGTCDFTLFQPWKVDFARSPSRSLALCPSGKFAQPLQTCFIIAPSSSVRPRPSNAQSAHRPPFNATFSMFSYMSHLVPDSGISADQPSITFHKRLAVKFRFSSPFQGCSASEGIPVLASYTQCRRRVSSTRRTSPHHYAHLPRSPCPKMAPQALRPSQTTHRSAFLTLAQRSTMSRRH